MTGRFGVAAGLVASGVLVAACASSGGSPDVPVPTGPASGASTSASARSHSSGTRATSRTSASTTHRAGHAASIGATTSARRGGAGAGGTRHASARPAPRRTGTMPANTCSSSSSAGAAITVCPARGLRDGQRVKITGAHFKPNENLLYMQCHYKGENAGSYGMSDCNVDFGQSTTSSAGGTVGPIYLAVSKSAGGADCTHKQCMVTVAAPLQSGNADNPHALIYFG